MEKFIIHYIEEFWNPRLDIPHSEKRYVGFNEDGKSLDVDVQCKYIYGGHVSSYMNFDTLVSAITAMNELDTHLRHRHPSLPIWQRCGNWMRSQCVPALFDVSTKIPYFLSSPFSTRT
ncbi:hypothetical protein L6452_16618 [Arctium lappa]|uniref:Uncharacterized protein n=1 Tax=Arctium lappa TaxID=4217 RepID=A0ACB9C168_ARCLA|nr:hypothetical protein L6452_16618 [Arctium lappa]